MIYFHEVMSMFGGIKTAAKQRREPTEVELSQAVEDMHRILASLVDSMTTIAINAQRRD